MQRQTPPADEVSDAEVIDSWEQAAEEFAELFAAGEQLDHKEIIIPCLMEGALCLASLSDAAAGIGSRRGGNGTG